MRSVIFVAVGLGLAGCSSMSMDAFKPTPKAISIPVDSVPSGADATSSLGPTCKTPCSLSVPDTADSFSVAFTLPKYQPLTVPVQATHHPGEYFTSPPTTTFDPNPIVGELQAEAPKKPARKRPRKRRAPAAAAPAAGAAGSAFPAPSAAPAAPPATPAQPAR